jgi:arylsulfatase A-like enzyme
VATFLLRIAFLAQAAAISAACSPAAARSGQGDSTPNVVLIITDDQGYGDLGIHGNRKIQTPHIDRLARESVRFQSFYVSPVCSPTRASLMTGRYNYRTGVVDTFLGRSLMHPDEVTLAEMLSARGYRTGVFGKWHLGDNYPMRAMDQGFQESLVLNGGGIGQPSDPPGGTSYFDPMLRQNGEWVKTKGYVSDVLTDAAIAFIAKHRDRPFFTYLAFNAPHAPLEVPEKYHARYRQMGLKPDDFPGVEQIGGHPIASGFDAAVTAKIYGMVENIDDNIGRLLATIDELKLTGDTIVLFMTDNGPQQPRYNAGMLQRKGSTHEGGVRVPLFVRWPGRFTARQVVEIGAHIDVAPTLLDACGVAKPAPVKFDGVSLLPLLKGQTTDWPDRTLFFQWHRGDVPMLYRAFAARTRRYKLVQPDGAGVTGPAPEPVFKLYDLSVDPLETKDIAGAEPQRVAHLKREYEAWFKDVTGARDYTHPSRIYLGATEENPVRLTRQDWRGPKAGWTPTSLGHWHVDVKGAGEYAIKVRFDRLRTPGTVRCSLNGAELQREVSADATTAAFDKTRLARGPGLLECAVTQNQAAIGMIDVVVEHFP